MPGLDVALQHIREPAWSPYKTSCVRYVNQRVSLRTILSDNPVKDVYVDVVGPLELWEEVTEGWNGREEDYEQQRDGQARPHRKRAKVSYSKKINKKINKREAFLFLGDPLFYNFFALEGHQKNCANCAKHLPFLISLLISIRTRVPSKIQTMRRTYTNSL